MATVSISQAARMAGKARNTLYDHIKKGKLSATQDKQGKTVIDVAELERVYGSLSDPNVSDRSKSNNTGHSETAQLRQENSLLRQLLKSKDEIIEQQQGRIGDLRRLLPPAQPAQAQTDVLVTPPPGQAPKRRWWQFGRSA